MTQACWQLKWLVTQSPISVRKTKGGEAITGVFFREQTADSVASAILSFESSEDMSVPEDIQLHACQFDASVFVERLRNYVERVVSNGREISEIKKTDRVSGSRYTNLHGLGDIARSDLTND
jgi:hypothetical protein